MNAILQLFRAAPVLGLRAGRDTWQMDSYQGTATLEWWANESTCLGEFDVQVSVCVVGDDWVCDAMLGPERLSDDHREVFDLLLDLDSVFTLRFDESSEILVNVVRVGDSGHLALTAYVPIASAA
ncbi:hypothetical protein ACFVHW_16055 [Streptomyces sp. NPDC127110]|uniref:hypothetical protein n=1 Tax=Streptomyces sp. NPDC127110 TaxID=3345362 RepID=UPI003626865E